MMNDIFTSKVEALAAAKSRLFLAGLMAVSLPSMTVSAQEREEDGPVVTNITPEELGEERPPGPDPRYLIRSGIYEVTSTLDGGFHQTIYFDDYGEREAIYSETGLLDRKMESVAIREGGWIISYDVGGRIGQRVPAGSSLEDEIPTPDRLTPELREEYSYRELSPRTLLGMEIKGYSLTIEGVQVNMWEWNNIPIFVETRGGDVDFVLETVRLDADVKVPDEVFALPEGMIIEEAVVDDPPAQESDAARNGDGRSDDRVIRSEP